MKRLLTPLLLGIAAATLAHAAPIAKITTLTGKTYRQCEIVRVHPDGVSFRHAEGAAKVLFTDLSMEWRTRLGYDADKAAAYKQELADKREAEKAARTKIEEARFKALAEAAARAHIQSLGQEAQARATVQSQSFGPSVIPVLPALGAVHDAGGGYARPSTWYGNGGYGYPAGFGYPSGYGFGIGFQTPGWGVCYPAAPVCPPRRSFRVTITR